MVNPFEMVTGDIRLSDIARSLSMINRYNGHTNFAFSVAQHSILLSEAAAVHAANDGYIRTPSDFAMMRKAAFAHDWSETYCHDIMTPVKGQLSFNGVPFHEVEEGIQQLIFHKFDIPWDFMDIVIPYDKRIYEDEAPVLKPLHEPSGLKPLGVQIVEWPDWRYAEQRFYEWFRFLEMKDETEQ
jgi:5'-deoxynucleotidase YfbR-like HD superfamily hydrolase